MYLVFYIPGTWYVPLAPEKCKNDLRQFSDTAAVAVYQVPVISSTINSISLSNNAVIRWLVAAS